MSVMPGRLGRLVTSLTAVAALGAALVSGPGTASAAEESNGPHYQQPSVGQCRNYTIDAAFKDSNNSPVVACSTKHTAKVIAVPQLPSSLNWGSPMSSIERAMTKACYPKFEDILGRTTRVRARTSYTLMWFIPTQAQRDHGARWLRCDVAIWGGNVLQPLPTNKTPMLPASGIPNKVARCLVGDQFLITVCAKTHRYRATDTTVVDRATFPGNKTLLAIAKKRCPNLVSTPRNYYATWPDKQIWNMGNHVIVCYSHTSN